MKRILFVMHSLGFGGAERSLVNLLSEMPEREFCVDLLLFQPSGALLEQLPGWVNVIKTPEKLARLYGPTKRAGALLGAKIGGALCGRLMRRKKKAQKAWRWNHVYSRRIDALSGHYDTAIAFTGAEIMYYVAEKVDADRKIVFIHNDYCSAGYSAEDDAPYMEKMDAIVSISRRCVEVLEQVFPEHSGRMVYLENITSSSLIRKRADMPIGEAYGQAAVKILSVGRLWPQKGFDLAIEAAALLRDRGVDFCWLILGEGSLRGELQRLIHQHGLDERVLLIGAKENPYPYMKACDVLVQSSRYEGKSVVLDEAKILGKPIVVTRYQTVADQIEDGKEGLITDMTAGGMAEGIQKMIGSDGLSGAISRYLLAHEYGNQAEIDKYLDLLNR